MAAAVERTCYRHPDRVTGLSCSECGRPICTECMTMAPVGIRCPEHSGRPQGVQRVTSGVRRAAYEGAGAKVTRALIAINILVYVAELLQGSGVSATKGSIYQNGALLANGAKFANSLIGLPAHVPYPQLVGVAHGDWWRLMTSAFLHYGPFHIILNMLALWWFGSALERRIGSGRVLAIYLVSAPPRSGRRGVWAGRPGRRADARPDDADGRRIRRDLRHPRCGARDGAGAT